MKKIYAILICFGIFFTASAQNVQVTFQVDMNNQTVTSNGVHVAGSFQKWDTTSFGDSTMHEWDPGHTELTDGDGDGVYTYTANLPAGTYQYKFINGNAWGGDESVPGSCNVSGNREVVVAGAMTIDKVCFASCSPCPTAVDTVNLVFKVDMSQQTVSSNGVHVAGDFGAGGYATWDPAAIELTDGDGDDIYETTLKLPQGTYPFKFINGNDWGSAESVPGECNSGGNREYQLMGDGDDSSEFLADPVTYLVAFGNCLPVDSVDVTFRVGMSNETVSDSGVHMAGAFEPGGYPGWNPDGIELTDGDGDDVYEVTLRLPEGDYSFKFVNGNAWGSEEGVPSACNVDNNRKVHFAGNGDAFSDVGIPLTYEVCFGSCDFPCVEPLPPINVTFRVDMSNEIVEASGLFVAGEFKGAIWVKDSFKFTDDNTDDIYEATILLDPKEYQFKFYNGDCGDDGCGETHDFGADGCGTSSFKNRIADLSNATNDTILPAYFFNSCDVSTASITDLYRGSLNVYPNPAHQQVQVDFDNPTNADFTVRLLDLSGRVVEQSSTNGNSAVLSWNNLPKGMYFIHLSSEQNGSAVRKLSIQ